MEVVKTRFNTSRKPEIQMSKKKVKSDPELFRKLLDEEKKKKGVR